MEIEGPQPRKSPMTRIFWFLVIVGLAFLAGFGWQYLEASRLRAELKTLQGELALQNLEISLTDAAVRTLSGGYEEARAQASSFFTDLQNHVNGLAPDAAAELNGILSRRDDVIAALSRSEPVAGELLAQIMAEFATITGRDQRALPPPAGSGDEMVPEAPGDTIPSTSDTGEAARESGSQATDSVADTTRGGLSQRP